jgi:hypothetical protein
VRITSCRSPEKLLEELGITEPDRLDVEAIAYACRATVVKEPLQKCEAHLFARNGKALITVNSSAPVGRQRFSVAHELGHWIIDRGKVATACGQIAYTTGWSSDNPEFRANQYAADLLMPRSMFQKFAKNRQMVFDTVHNLKERFRTSTVATAIRLVDLGSFPAMLVCNEVGKPRWKWFHRGPDIPQPLWPQDEPSVYTLAYDILRGESKTQGPTSVDADCWIDHPGASEYSLIEDSVEVMPGVVLSMLWWKNERPLIELTEAEDEDHD